MQQGIIGALLRKLGTKRGAPHVYLDGGTPEKAGFAPGLRFSLEQRGEDACLVLRLAEDGERTVSSKVKDGRLVPVVDINSAQALAMFAGMEQVRVLLRRGEIWILPLASESRRKARLARLEAELVRGQVSTAGVCTGAGVLSNALHAGLSDAGLRPSLRWAVEIDGDALEQAQRANPVFADTLCVAMPLQELALSDVWTLRQLPQVSVLEAGLPCTAASVAGRSKKGLAQAEDDAKAGHLVAGFLALVAQANPAVLLLENVVPYFNTASAAILRAQLAEMGYAVEERTLDGKDYAIESRVRKVLVAVTQGCGITLDALVPPQRAAQTVGSILDPVPLDAACWSEMGYLRDKQERDSAAGKGFRMAVVGPEATSVGTIGTGYQKNRSTEPKLQHPENPALLRLFTPAEHARIKGIPESLIAGITSATYAHALLGQSVIWPAFRELGRTLGTALTRAAPELSLAKAA